ncbi:hypothetical protein WDU94_007217 [Cyamophila willieti]
MAKDERKGLPRTYGPLLEEQVQQFYNEGCYFYKKRNYEQSLHSLDKALEPVVNPDHLPMSEATVHKLVLKSLKKKIAICAEVGLYDVGFEDCALLQTYSKKAAKDTRYKQTVPNY